MLHLKLETHYNDKLSDNCGIAINIAKKLGCLVSFIHRRKIILVNENTTVEEVIADIGDSINTNI